MKKMKMTVITVLITLFIIISLSIWWFDTQQKILPEGLIQTNGRIEGDHYTVASKVPGKVMQLLAHEGDAVKEGQVLVKLDDVQVRARVAQSQAELEILSAQLKSSQTTLAMMKKQIPLQIDTAKAEIAHADAALASAKASAKQAAKDSRRFSELLKKNTVDKETAEHKNLTWTIARAEFATAMAALTQSKKRLAEAELGWEKIEAKKHDVASIVAKLKQAQAALVEKQSVLDDLTIQAPATGTITTRIIDKGEVVVAGSPLFDIVDLNRLYLKVYVPEIKIGKVRLNLPARIYTDAFPEKPFAATVRYIASQAEFTPKEVQTPDERVKLVFAVKLYLNENPHQQLAPGLPADAIIRWQEGASWAKPRW